MEHAFEGLALGCGSGPLTGRYPPPLVGGFRTSSGLELEHAVPIAVFVPERSGSSIATLALAFRSEHD